MQKVYFFILFSIISIISLASRDKEIDNNKFSKNFKGILEYVEYTPFDTTYYKVYVSEDKIRVDTYDNIDVKGTINKSLIYNLKDKKVIALKPSEKIYKTINVDSDSEHGVDGCEIILNKNNYKFINGYKCVQYRIKNVNENTDITYWIPEEDFPFYYEMVRMKRSMHRVHKYFFMLPNYKVAFPMQTVERSLLREQKSAYKVIDFEEKIVEETVFEIPKDYILND